MQRPSPSPRLSLPRLLLTLWLAFAVLLQPVLGALGEVHEAAAHVVAAGDLHPDDAGLHDGRGGDAPGVVTPGAGAPEDGGALHVLLHFAHCCGQSMGMAVEAAITPALRVDAARLLPAAPASHPRVRLTSPFRPPISA